MVEIVEVASLEGWAEPWDRLVEAADLPSPFLQSWWLGAVAGRGGSPEFVLVIEEDRLLGGVALVADRWYGARRLRLLGSGALCPDHLDAVIDPAQRDRTEAELGRWFDRRRRVLIELSGLAQDAALPRVLGLRPEVIDVAPYGPVPRGAADYLATRSRNTRSSVGRSQRRLAAAGHVHRRLDPVELDDAVDWFVGLQREREGREHLLVELPALRMILAAGLERGEVALDVLQHPDGRPPVALAITFHVSGRVSLYQLARSLEPEASGAGSALLGHVFDRAILDGAVEIDLLRGDETYKASWVDARRSLVRVRAGRGMLPRVLVAALTSRRRLHERPSLSATPTSPVDRAHASPPGESASPSP